MRRRQQVAVGGLAAAARPSVWRRWQTNGQSWVDPSAVPAGDSLRAYGVDLTERARSGKLDPIIGRDVEIRRTLQVLARRTKNNPLLIGEPGTGKTAVIEGLAQRIAEGDVPESIKNNVVVSLDLSALVAGASYQGQFEQRLKSVLKDVQESKRPVILFIDEIHMLVGAGGGGRSGGMDASQILKPHLARGELHCIGATTLDEYRKYIEKDAALARRFQTVLVSEPSVEDTIAILRGLEPRYEIHHGVRIADSALVAAAVYSNRYISERFLPDKAIDLIDEAASRLRLQQESKPEQLENIDRQLSRKKMEVEALKRETDAASRERRKDVEAAVAELEKESAALRARWNRERSQLQGIKEKQKQLEDLRLEAARTERRGDLERASRLLYELIPKLEREIAADEQAHAGQRDEALLHDTVTERDIARVISSATGIPVENLLQSDRERLLNLESHLERSVVGQNEAVMAIANTIRIARAGLQNGARPIGSFLFLGSSGVGKTELCKVLADFMFNSRDALVRIDMTEYMEKHTVSRLIGAPPGYVGYDDAGQLTEPVRRRPYSIVLFDEIEKAHPDVINVLLQLLDDGRLTDAQGRVVDFTNTIVVMTSNLGAQYIMQLPDDAPAAQAHAAVMSIVQQAFLPEFINRIDEVVLFNRLRKIDLDRIVDIQVDQLRPMLADKQISIELTDRARLFLAERGYDPQYGARPLKRCIQQKLVQPLSLLILRGQLPPFSHVVVRLDPNDEESLDFQVTQHQPAE